ncbi:MAG: restriction endonuclease subunit M [Epsilonproteobacteria bacterium]|nr:MAG: restriction endonuclease subunit M [Campylobacterota bacterium]
MELKEILEDKTIQLGRKNNIFKIDENTNYIEYYLGKELSIIKRYKLTNPEEFVRAKTLVEIVLEYKYDLEYIDFEVGTAIGSKPDIPADIIIFNDPDHKSPYIVYELKKEDITPKEFEQAVNQAFSYAVTQNAKYVAVSNGTKQAFYEVLADKPRERETNVISHIPIKFDESSKNKPKFIKGENDPKPKTESELIQKFKTCHDTLWAGGKRAPTEAFDELDKVIFCKFFDEKAPRKKGEAYDFQIYGTTKQTEERIKALYEEGRKKDPQVFREGIKLNNYELIEIVKVLQDINLSKTDLDAKGKAFETFMDGFFRGAFGQFFTPREVVKMIVNVLPIKNTHKVLDTSCGSGGFLLYALDKVRKLANDYYDDSSNEHYRFWHDFAEKQLFGVEINEQISRTAKMNMIIHDDGHTNVITYDGLKPINNIFEDTNNQHFIKDSFNFILTNPPFGGSIKSTELDGFENYKLAWKKPHFFDKRFKNTKDKIKANERSEVLFIERAYEYLATDGILAIVLPDGVLTNSTLEYVRDFIEEYFQYLAIISLPAHTFSVSDAGVKSSVLFLKRYSKEKTEQIQGLKEKYQDEAYRKYEIEVNEAKKQKDKESIAKYKEIVEDTYKVNFKEAIRNNLDCEIFMANAQTIGYESNGKPSEYNDLIEIAEQLKEFLQGKL